MIAPGPVALGVVWEAARHARMMARLGWELPGYLRSPITLEAARQRVATNLATREQRFLALMARAVYRHARSPYRHLLRQAGCELGDLRRLVGQEGVEGALRQLASAGVYVTFDELKGRREIVRGSFRLRVREADFDHPLARFAYVEATGGSRGRPSLVGRNLRSVTDIAHSFALVLDAHGIVRPRALLWIGGSLTWAIALSKLGIPIDAWFYPVHPLPRLAYLRLVYAWLLHQLAGRRLPPLAYCPLLQPEPIVARLVGGTRPVLVNTTSSSAVRISAAAARLGHTLGGVTFHCRSEPLTAARRRQIEAAGARALADYASVELSSIGYGCAAGVGPDDLHLMLDRYAVTARERPVFEHGPVVEALLLTTLSPYAPKIALNTELGDVARVEQRACDCSLGALGLTVHLSEVRSFEKLSSEGTTFAREQVLRIVEEVLPARFGGSPLDYQLVEEEQADGRSALVLRAHPHLGPLDEAAIRATLLHALGRDGIIDRYQASLIERAESIAVRRLPPLATRGGKVLPFHLARTTPAER